MISILSIKMYAPILRFLENIIKARNIYESKKKKKKKKENLREFLLWLSRLRTGCYLLQAMGSIPGLDPWVKKPALLQAAG